MAGDTDVYLCTGYLKLNLMTFIVIAVIVHKKIFKK